MRVEYEQSNVRMDVTIKLTGITEDLYRDIVAFIAVRDQRSNEEHADKADKKRLEEYRNTERQKEQVIVDTKQKAVTDTKQNKKIKKKDANPKLDKIVELYKDYELHRENYSVIEQTVAEFLDGNAEFEGVSSQGLACRLRSMNIEHRLDKRRSKSGTTEVLKVYKFPILKDAKEVDPPAADSDISLGLRIKELRRQNHFTPDELAHAIGYSKECILKWEHDQLTPSSEAIEELKKVFGVESL